MKKNVLAFSENNSLITKKNIISKVLFFLKLHQIKQIKKNYIKLNEQQNLEIFNFYLNLF